WGAAPIEGLPRRLGLPGARVEVRRRRVAGLAAWHVAVRAGDAPALRDLEALLGVLRAADLPGPVQERAAAVVEDLARAEAEVHGCTTAEVHLHEVGTVDTLVDVAGTILGLHELGVARLVASPLPVGRGWTEGAHGRLPLPAPATARLLEGVPVYGVPESFELVTPTGAALVRRLADGFGDMPPLRVSGVGYGAGDHPRASGPNLLRLWLGEPEGGWTADRVLEIETWIDDMNPEFYPPLVEALLAEGALDVSLVPVHMKKNRPGTAVTVVAPPGLEARVCARLFRDTTTAGVRIRECRRRLLPRRTGRVPTPWGPVGAKLVERPGRGAELAPEFEACKKVAEAAGVSVREVAQAVASVPVARFADDGEEGPDGSGAGN
ncbi:nickel pincer cofactor biosynthesis protein LarC, partial [Dissulfurirhabdus thermomarina]